ncbi:hypothetical protein XENORESO_007924 [Xenotaenia resolanae]|uniref:Uncharacterized protein n=1 Tax=Xenotaenia resolanae TaxID=208358 RepID=A0ABV0WVQ2_9TELE
MNRLVRDPDSGRPAPILPGYRQQAGRGTSGGPVIVAPDPRCIINTDRDQILPVMMRWDVEDIWSWICPRLSLTRSTIWRSCRCKLKVLLTNSYYCAFGPLVQVSKKEMLK